MLSTHVYVVREIKKCGRVIVFRCRTNLFFSFPIMCWTVLITSICQVDFFRQMMYFNKNIACLPEQNMLSDLGFFFDFFW